MGRIITIANQKGGVAKTTTVGTMTAILVDMGYRVLAVDLDPQGNLTDSIGADGYTKPTIYEAMKREISVDDVIQKTDACDILPANIMLSGVEQEFNMIGRELRLKETLEPLKNDYDFIIIDTPPALGILTTNAIAAADEILIPSVAAIFAVKGIRQMYDTIRNVQRYLNPNLICAGVLITRYTEQKNNAKDMKDLTEQMAGLIHAPVFKSCIRDAVAVQEAQARSIDLFAYNERNAKKVRADYLAFVHEYLDMYNARVNGEPV